MEPSTMSEFDQGRDLSKKAVRAVCYAPHTNLYFDQWGRVRACCWNAEPIGDISKEKIDQIWQGARLAALRSAMERYELAKGCGICAKQIDAGWLKTCNALKFDYLGVVDAVPTWPRRIELSISNSCNLECVMCSGDFSSAIRTRRDHLPPRPRIYPEDFPTMLRKYIPHLNSIKFLGGEPFLVPEYYQIWNMMVEDGLTIECHLTTNGTQYNSRIEKIMEALPMSFAVSLDGASKRTVESIRVNANYEEQMKILRIFREYTKRKKTDLSLTYCFMRQNWHEFGEYCLFADELECSVGVNTVNYPAEFAVYNLPTAELGKILTEMERQSIGLATRLTQNKKIWFDELERVRLKCRE
jgi:sulfatase maturation enzyme AslB (radical SAM superfamily)